MQVKHIRETFQLNSIQSQFRAWTVRSSISACLLLTFIITITQLEAARNSFENQTTSSTGSIQIQLNIITD
jgi:hypothetical protein